MYPESCFVSKIISFSPEKHDQLSGEIPDFLSSEVGSNFLNLWFEIDQEITKSPTKYILYRQDDNSKDGRLIKMYCKV